jgi:hypothetical protein
MDQTRMTDRETAGAIADRARIAVSGEHRLQRLERPFRWTAAFFLLTLVLALYALFQGLAAGPARAQLGWPHAIPELAPEAAESAADAGRAGAEGFRTRIDELRVRVAAAEPDELDPTHALVVILHDIKDTLQETRQMLAVMPEMAEDLRQMRGDMERIAGTIGAMDGKMAGIPVMAEEMRRLSINIDIMTTSIDSTMGRMGRMMPYLW